MACPVPCQSPFAELNSEYQLLVTYVGLSTLVLEPGCKMAHGYVVAFGDFVLFFDIFERLFFFLKKKICKNAFSESPLR